MITRLLWLIFLISFSNSSLALKLDWDEGSVANGYAVIDGNAITKNLFSEYVPNTMRYWKKDKYVYLIVEGGNNITDQFLSFGPNVLNKPCNYNNHETAYEEALGFFGYEEGSSGIALIRLNLDNGKTKFAHYKEEDPVFMYVLGDNFGELKCDFPTRPSQVSEAPKISVSSTISFPHLLAYNKHLDRRSLIDINELVWSRWDGGNELQYSPYQSGVLYYMPASTIGEDDDYFELKADPLISGKVSMTYNVNRRKDLPNGEASGSGAGAFGPYKRFSQPCLTGYNSWEGVITEDVVCSHTFIDNPPSSVSHTYDIKSLNNVEGLFGDLHNQDIFKPINPKTLPKLKIPTIKGRKLCSDSWTNGFCYFDTQAPRHFAEFVNALDLTESFGIRDISAFSDGNGQAYGVVSYVKNLENADKVSKFYSPDGQKLSVVGGTDEYISNHQLIASQWLAILESLGM